MKTNLISWILFISYLPIISFQLYPDIEGQELAKAIYVQLHDYYSQRLGR